MRRMCRFRGQAASRKDFLELSTAERLELKAALVRRDTERVRELLNAARPTAVEAEVEALVAQCYGAEAPIVSDILRFGDLVERVAPTPRLQECLLRDDAVLWITLSNPTRPLEVRPGDEFVEGVLFVGDLREGTWQVQSRLVRLMCGNGQVMPLSVTLGASVYTRRSDGTTEGDLGETVESAFSGRVLEASTEMLRRAAAVPAQNPDAALLMLRMREADRRLPEEVLHRATREEPTVYGVLNAVTRTARDTPGLGRRLWLERLAGRMIERASGLPAGARQADRQPV